MTEVLKVELLMKNGRKRDLAVVYDTYNGLNNMIENSDNIIMKGDFNCKEVCLEEWYTGRGKKLWGGIVLDLIINNMTRGLKRT